MQLTDCILLPSTSLECLGVARQPILPDLVMQQTLDSCFTSITLQPWKRSHLQESHLINVS